MASRGRRLLDLGSLAVRPVPISVLHRAGALIGRRVAPHHDAGRIALGDNLRHVVPDASQSEIDELVRAGFGSYGRYWAEIFKLPTLSASTIDAGFGVDGYHHIQKARTAGIGPIMALPHLGGWEWAAAWLGRVGEIPVTAVVEPLEPPDVAEWFRTVRASYGINVVPLGPRALGEIAASIRRTDVVCLLADRDLTGSGVTVEFFGADASLPVGPALVARRTGAPLLPTAVYFDGSRRFCRIRPPIEVATGGSLRRDLRITTQRLAAEFEVLIEAAPEQWHVLQPLFGAGTA